MADEFRNGMPGAEQDPVVATTMHETDRKCPQCGGTMDFDPATGGLHCPYCDYNEEIPPVSAPSPIPEAHEGSASYIPFGVTADGRASELRFEDAELLENSDWGLETKTVICKSCGAESVYEAHVVSAECPYCGSNQVMEANDAKTMAPGGVVPFKISQQEASNRFIGWIKNKFFAPKLAKESAKADSFKGIYLPYWTFDAMTRSSYVAEYGKDRKVKDSDGQERTVTDWSKTSGNYEEFFNDELVCGTKQHDVNMLRAIEPFNTEENKAYRPEFVAGFAAERYSVGIKDAWEKAKTSIAEKIKNGISRKVMREYNADHVTGVRAQTDYSQRTYKYLLLPVWLSSFRYKDKVYRFMVNGQTGKVSGNSPVSVPKVILTILVILAILLLIYYFMG
ncbi:MAG: hypothetical protein K6F53_07855 [Lachnospiraceae bacterium]|nr:hypothetical protein [Lachnospiraceae bacterium]